MLTTEQKTIDEEEIKNAAQFSEGGKEALTEEVKTEPAVSKNSEILDEEMSLLSDLKKATDKDIDKTSSTSAPSTESSSAASSAASGSSEVVRKSNVQFQNHELVAKLCVAALNVAMGMVLQVISDDWSEEAEKKYTLSATRKGEILEPLTLVLEQSKSKYNPVVILVITVVVSYVPMFVSAFRTRKEKAASGKAKKKILDKVGSEIKNEFDEKEELKRQIQELSKGTSQTKTVEIFKMTEGQKARLKKIKATRGQRSASDKQFIIEMGLEGLV